MEDLSRELQAIERMLTISGKFNLQAEIVHSILSSLKQFPSLTIEEAIEHGMMYFKHLITIEE